MSKQEIMYSHVEDWRTSGLTQSRYCESVGIKLATFSYWVVKHKSESTQLDNNFITVTKGQVSKTQEYEIVYPNGVKLRLQTDNLSELYSLVNLV
ncbi:MULTISPECIES: IS66 family insertion sequence element accessory protein TnpA [Myroides]|uniref:IS66 family insertion sequence element accessory protein TnpA n=1 Tax=Myroides TaxID=76831 RepID=UPI0013215A91|nr:MULTISPECIES: IS66 family insertion sequence element accessory protein TnpB [Myroides]MVX34387.1 IS66 family insertion sequence element accessory protein TnpB [Myroides sp. LoEW2-1]UVD79147.1 IS66 family insertion sequence element accessory protein TnpB [Myroides albus]UVD80090.1 IS66 family insertion sequence element accessory protein TnpB [Myroides albus]